MVKKVLSIISAAIGAVALAVFLFGPAVECDKFNGGSSTGLELITGKGDIDKVITCLFTVIVAAIGIIFILLNGLKDNKAFGLLAIIAFVVAFILYRGTPNFVAKVVESNMLELGWFSTVVISTGMGAAIAMYSTIVVILLSIIATFKKA